MVSMVCVMVAILALVMSMWCGLVFVRGVVLVLMCLFLVCNLVSLVCLVMALLEELATQSVLPFRLNVRWGVWGGLVIIQLASTNFRTCSK